MFSEINNGLTVTIKTIARKIKGNSDRLDIYLRFIISHKKMEDLKPEISTNIQVDKTEWKKGKMIGRSLRANQINDEITKHIYNAKIILDNLRMKDVKSPNEIRDEILNTIKSNITGKAPRGSKQTFKSQLEKYTIQSVLDDYLTVKKLTKNRKENYERIIKVFIGFFKGRVTHISSIGENDVLSFYKWYSSNTKNVQNTQATYLNALRTIFNHAVAKRIIPFSPIPKRFVPSFIEVEREILDEKSIDDIFFLKDESLKKHELIAKHCMLFQRFTGMGYGDILSLKKTDIFYNRNLQRKFIVKDRNKTGIEFNIPLYAITLEIIEKLQSLTDATDERLFILVGRGTMNKHYKKLARKAKIKANVTTYAFRHTYATDYMDKGGKLEDLQKILGHKKSSTTAIYGKITQQRLNEPALMMERNNPIFQRSLQIAI